MNIDRRSVFVGKSATIPLKKRYRYLVQYRYTCTAVLHMFYQIDTEVQGPKYIRCPLFSPKMEIIIH